ncbi:hypothetical protein JI721_03615 [Alicyclobacillus cycloheptanicus]|uniref:Uncharacterized protein n=1 Tax=Alicyclobacillus cycloheptanicus TaxID=1457 RepID=A0ABT9XHE2_9BACL|nr:hypothetical protein [Alicyclobacillus cycloheptanicus]MDQ0189730.1 hypothetical protein [Alicyclobacillus cycloheptanicus]WDM01941.1 hypothetical protein JI721_03615 [Alicyclobacillus cycloheptanicus]
MSIGHLVDDDERFFESSVAGADERLIVEEVEEPAVAVRAVPSTSREITFILAFLILVGIFMVLI